MNTPPGVDPHCRVTMLIPSRDRPRQAIEAAISAIENAVLPNTNVQIIADGHDWGSPVGLQYSDAWGMMRRQLPGYAHRIQATYQAPHLGLVATLNRQVTVTVGVDGLANEHCCNQVNCGRVTHVGFMGDDHRIRTPGWDHTLAAAAGPWGIAYGDDGIQGAELPTAVVMSADIIRVLGKMGPPTLYHMYVDNYWRTLGESINGLTYVPGVSIPHLHPSVGLAELDESYMRTNAPEQYERDSAAWELYQRVQLLDDIELILHHKGRAARELEMLKAAVMHGLVSERIAIPPELVALYPEAIAKLGEEQS